MYDPGSADKWADAIGNHSADARADATRNSSPSAAYRTARLIDPVPRVAPGAPVERCYLRGAFAGKVLRGLRILLETTVRLL